ncbi:MAG: hypothetical protein KatS3mg101_1149 [Patescibacteria group bacterium]|nr:MAG: hypothetical protein KatS3mg101_1149 [Patescibacteria group bacterium]
MQVMETILTGLFASIASYIAVRERITKLEEREKLKDKQIEELRLEYKSLLLEMQSVKEILTEIRTIMKRNV